MVRSCPTIRVPSQRWDSAQKRHDLDRNQPESLAQLWYLLGLLLGVMTELTQHQQMVVGLPWSRVLQTAPRGVWLWSRPRLVGNGRRQDRGELRDGLGTDIDLWSALAAQAVEPCLLASVLFPASRPRTLGEHGLEPWTALAQAPGKAGCQGLKPARPGLIPLPIAKMALSAAAPILPTAAPSRWSRYDRKRKRWYSATVPCQASYSTLGKALIRRPVRTKTASLCGFLGPPVIASIIRRPLAPMMPLIA